ITNHDRLKQQAEAAREKALALLRRKDGSERLADIRNDMAKSMEEGCGIYRLEDEMQKNCDTIGELKKRYQKLNLDDRSRTWNTEWLTALELGFLLDVSQAIAFSAINRKESRGSHQRLDGFEERDDVNFLKHTLAFFDQETDRPRIEYMDVKITSSPPGVRAYGAAGEEAEAGKQ
ncbi:MAG: succinate dehydrogenase/fumarate reductase flavoprotein subunit, partial [Gammaproteobacteria bacterium]|nr:succinate dehydrogenase/fumarate reductase flavoprotein subunit [Gammaproteobacteria bacterium]